MMLSRIVRLKNIRSHPNADALDLVQVQGWQCVIRKGEFEEGDLAIYIEIDTWVPHDIAPFLSKGNDAKVYEGIFGQRVRTIRLRGELSQGLILPLSVLDFTQVGTPLFEGQDVTDILGIRKWHAPVPTHLAGEVLPWPDGIPKTDQENIQNLYDSSEWKDLTEVQWVIEEKLDGSSCTIYSKWDGSVGICSRNFELKINEANANNAFILAARRQGLLDAVAHASTMIAIQAELCGPGIQGNPYRLSEPTLFVFDVYWIEHSCYATVRERFAALKELEDAYSLKINRVPGIGGVRRLPSLKECLSMAYGKSMINGNVNREGLVFKTLRRMDGKVYSFKACSNDYLLARDKKR